MGKHPNGLKSNSETEIFMHARERQLALAESFYFPVSAMSIFRVSKIKIAI